VLVCSDSNAVNALPLLLHEADVIKIYPKFSLRINLVGLVSWQGRQFAHKPRLLKFCNTSMCILTVDDKPVANDLFACKYLRNPTPLNY
jgi:hypothetical protein